LSDGLQSISFHQFTLSLLYAQPSHKRPVACRPEAIDSDVFTDGSYTLISGVSQGQPNARPTCPKPFRNKKWSSCRFPYSRTTIG